MEITNKRIEPQRIDAAALPRVHALTLATGGQLAADVMGRVQGRSVPAFGAYAFDGVVMAPASGVVATPKIPATTGVVGFRTRSAPV